MFSCISADLSIAATDSGTATAKAAQGTLAGTNILNIVDQVADALSGNQDTFQSNTQQVQQAQQNCQNIAQQGTAQMQQSVGMVNGNGNLVGVDVNIQQSQNQENGNNAMNGNGAVQAGAQAQAGGQTQASGSQENAAAPAQTAQPQQQESQTMTL